MPPASAKLFSSAIMRSSVAYWILRKGEEWFRPGGSVRTRARGKLESHTGTDRPPRRLPGIFEAGPAGGRALRMFLRTSRNRASSLLSDNRDWLRCHAPCPRTLGPGSRCFGLCLPTRGSGCALTGPGRLAKLLCEFCPAASKPAGRSETETTVKIPARKRISREP